MKPKPEIARIELGHGRFLGIRMSGQNYGFVELQELGHKLVVGGREPQPIGRPIMVPGEVVGQLLAPLSKAARIAETCGRNPESLPGSGKKQAGKNDKRGRKRR